MANLPLDIRLEIRNLKDVQRAMEDKVRQLSGEPMLMAIRYCALTIERDAKIFAPVDTGRLRASITPEVRAEGDVIMGVVGSNVEYAPYQELGTKFMEGRHYLQRSVEKNEQKIVTAIDKAVGEIAKA